MTQRSQDDIDIDNLDPVISMSRADGHESPFDIIDTPWGHIERWRASTLSTGTMGALHQVYDLVRNDATEAVARVEQTEARKALIQHLCDQIATMQNKITALEDALNARHRADEEREEREAAQREFEEEPLALPPEPGDLDDPTALEDTDIDTHQPGGELHTIAPKEEPPLETEGDELGDLPEELKDLPDPPPEPRGSVYPQPVSISLNALNEE